MAAPRRLTTQEHGDVTVVGDPIAWDEFKPIPFRGADNRPPCFAPVPAAAGRAEQAGYYVGADWLRPATLTVQITPKYEDVDHAGMLFGCLRHSSVAPHVAGLYTVDVDAPSIEVARHHDLLTPLLVTHFLQLLRAIVRKGVKQGYVPVAEELRARVKGKVDVARTIRHGVFKQRLLTTACRYDVLSPDIAENRYLKRVLRFVERVVAAYPAYRAQLAPTLAYCTPAFATVSEEEDTAVLRHPRRNPLFAEYNDALRVGQLLLARFGYALENVVPDSAITATVHVPPHWVDMSKLFELHVLGLLKDKFGEAAVEYQVGGNYGAPDYLIHVANGERWIADAKYKPVYEAAKYDSDNIRQISGYARDCGVLKRLGYSESVRETIVVPCLILYPAPARITSGQPVYLPDDLRAKKVTQFTQFFKMPVPMPGRPAVATPM